MKVEKPEEIKVRQFYWYLPADLALFLEKRKVTGTDIYACGGIFIEFYVKTKEEAYKDAGVALKTKVKEGVSLAVRTPKQGLFIGEGRSIYRKKVYSNTAFIFRDMFDMFAARHLELINPDNVDLICLNGIDNLVDVYIEKVLSKYRRLYLCLNNDERGQAGVEKVLDIKIIKIIGGI